MRTKKYCRPRARTQANRVAVQSPTTDLLTHACMKVSLLFKLSVTNIMTIQEDYM
jgi:hypothetical protein